MLATKAIRSVITELTAPRRGSLASKFTQFVSDKEVAGGEVMFWIKTPLFCVSVCECAVLAKG